jgi:nucleoside-diphosphate-sugar epimerase
MNILITGVAGFIGSHLSERLLQMNHSIYGIDNFDDFYPEETKKNNLKVSQNSEKFNLIKADINDIEIAVKGKLTSVDLVIHLAAKAGVRPSIVNPKEYIHANIAGTEKLLEWMKSSGCRKLIFASSSSVYGNNIKIPFSESDRVDFPISPYAFTKKSCELLNHTYHHLYNIDIINLRFFTVYGPRQRPDLAIHKFFDLVYQDKPVNIYGDGKTGRDYTYVDDTVSGICSSIDRIMSNEKLYEIINLGNNKPVILNDLVHTIEQVTGKKIKRNHLPMQEGDVDLTYADISVAKQKLNFNPSTTLLDGLNKFKIWYESR